MTLDPALLVLIEGEIDAYRMIATWPLVGDASDQDDVRQVVEDAEGGWADVSDLIGLWARSSGLDWTTIARWIPVLFRNGILGPLGQVDEGAAAIVRTLGSSRLQRALDQERKRQAKAEPEPS